MTFSAAQLKQQAQSLGFNLVGITPAVPSPHLEAYFRWIDAGQHGEMGYLARPDRQARRRDLTVILPEARSLVMVGMDYHMLNLPDQIASDPSRGRIAAYAWGADYHDVLAPRLEQLAQWLRAQSQHTIRHRVYVDTGAILERSHGQQAGLGFVGKNTLLISPRRGSYFFLGEIITDLAFDTYDQPHRETMCGSCTRCQTACPTAAFPAPYVLDARRCISYLTIENRGWIERDLRPLMGNWIMGCDVCQAVCPWQRFAIQTLETAFFPSDLDRAAPALLDLLQLTDESFAARYAGSPLSRIKRERLVRNACVAAGNWGDPAALPLLGGLLSDASPLVRGHAAWAHGRIAGPTAVAALVTRLPDEPDPAVRAEIAWALDALSAV
jgi:epoxyqueuosine reductase